MRARCEKPDHPAFVNYGHRGIAVCERWYSFEAFLEDMGPRPSARHSLERENNDLGYQPGNCRWATRGEQARNTRVNRIVTFRGSEMTLAQAAELAGVSYSTACRRLNTGWSLDAALTPPERRSGRPILVRWEGRDRSLRDVCRERGADPYLVASRLKLGWEMAEALSVPARAVAKRAAPRRALQPVIVEFQGSSRRLVDLCRELGADYRVVRQRVGMGWDIGRALIEPKRPRSRRARA